MTRILLALLLAVSAASATEPIAPPTAPVPAGDYKLDRSHASLIFRVDHLGFSRYTARFTRFDAQLQFDPANLAAGKVDVQVDARSIETDFPDPAKLDFNAKLQGADWLDTGRHPEIRFRSTRVELLGGGAMRIHGELTLRGVTRPVTMDARYNGGYGGMELDPQARIGFSARGSLQRSAFGMAYGVPAPGSTFGVGDEVSFEIEAEFNGPAWKPA